MVAFARLVSQDPPVILGGTGNGWLGPAAFLAEALPRQAYFLNTFWQFLDAYRVEELRAALAAHLKLWPEHRFLYHANDLGQLDLLRRAEIPCILGNHNLFVSEAVYDVEPRPSRRYQAIYNARMSPFKRHALCEKLPSVAFIYYFNPKDDFSTYDEAQRLIPHAAFLNGDPRSEKGPAFLSSQDCARAYNQARVGLCLSAREGAMYSSMEYLLCGLPVVTTPNMGGRNHFFRPEYAELVDPTSADVKRGVEAMLRRNLKAADVREEVLRLLRFERERYFDDVQRYFDRAGERIDFRARFHERYRDKMADVVRAPQDLFAS